VFILAYVVFFTQIFSMISSGVNFIATPMWKAQNTISGVFNDIGAAITSKKELNDEIRRLKEELEIAGVKLLDRNLLYEENVNLKEILDRDTSYSSVFAVVLTKPNRSPYDTVIIDVGRNAGIESGGIVLYGDNIVIGKISDVYKNSSKVILFSSPGEELDVVVGKDNIPTTAYGRGGGNFELRLPRDTDVFVGDVVYVPGINTRVLGRIEYIESKPSDPFKTMILKGPVNIFKIKWVEVETGN